MANKSKSFDQEAILMNRLLKLFSDLRELDERAPLRVLSYLQERMNGPATISGPLLDEGKK